MSRRLLRLHHQFKSVVHVCLFVLVWQLATCIPPAAAAFTPTFTTPATSCGSFTVAWNASSDTQTGPPYTLLIVPVNDNSAQSDNAVGGGVNTAVPVQYAIPSSAWDATNRHGSYTVDKLPLPTGERFIVVMDDGFGLGTGGVSTIQHVSEQSSDSSCLPADGTNSQTLFGLSTNQPAQCSTLTIQSAPPKTIRGFIPGGSPFSLDVPTLQADTVSTNWDVNVPAGSSFVLVLELNNGTMVTSGLLGSGNSNGAGDACLSSNALHSTIGSSGTTAALAAASNTDAGGSGSNKGRTAAIAGGIVGGLALLAFAALLTFFCILRRTDSMGRPRSRSTVSPYNGGQSYEFTSTNSSGWGRMGENKPAENNNRPGTSKSKKGKDDGNNTLEGRFGGGLFGGGKKKGASGARKDRSLTSRQKREMYPGFSFASTQNRSIGVTSGEESIGRIEEGRLPSSNIPASGLSAGNGSLQAGSMGGATISNMPSAWRDVKRNEARQHSRQDNGDGTSSMTSGGISIADSLEEERRLDTIRESDGGASLTREGSGYSAYHSAESHLKHSLTSSLPYSNSSAAGLLSETKTSDLSTSNSTKRRQGNDRPSTAPTGDGIPHFHLPSGGRSIGHESDGVHAPEARLHEYPPDRKHPARTGQTGLLDDDRYDIEDDEETDGSIPKVNEGLLSGPDEADRRTDGGSVNFVDAFEGGERAWSHPYATASSPHTDISPLPFHQRRPPPSSMPRSSSGTHIHSSSSTSPSRRGDSRYASRSPPTIIRHIDGGSMAESEDFERQRVVELPPSYDEVPRGGSGRGGGGSSGGGRRLRRRE